LLFSPSLEISKENVLHSIFSPTNGGATRHYRAPFSDATNLNALGRPEPRKNKFTPSKSDASGPDHFFNPTRRTPLLQSTIKCSQACSPGTHDIFFSPRTFHSSSSPLSTISALSYSTTGTSFRSVPIDMLSFTYVTECTSEVELEQIINSLQADSPGNYPSLLKAAKHRLDLARAVTSTQDKILNERDSQFSTLHVSSTSSESSSAKGKPAIFRVDSTSKGDDDVQRSDVPSIQRSLAWSQTTHISSNSQIDESSLVMSVSTTFLEELESDVASKISEPRQNAVNPTSEQINDPKHIMPQPSSIPRHIPPVSGKLQEQLQKMRDERSALERNLKDQVLEMNRKLENLVNTKQREQSVLSGKLNEVEKKKAQLEDEVEMLETAVRIAAEKAKDIVSSMTMMRHESQSLRTALIEEKENRKVKETRAIEIEVDLREQVTQLSSLLVHSEISAKQTKEITEMTMRNEFDHERLQHKLAAQALNRCLQEARSMLQNLKSERSSILHALASALGKDTSEVSKFNSAKRNEIVNEVSTKLASSKSAIKAFAKALACSENDCRAMKETNASLELRMADLKSLSSRLERENLFLTKQNQQLAEELENSRLCIDNLLLKNDINKGWKLREEEYKRTIEVLKKQIRTSESVVSIALYQQAVGEARQKELKCREKEQEILILRSNIGALEDSLKNSKTDSKFRLLKLNKISPTNETCTHERAKVALYQTPKKTLAPVQPMPQPCSTGKQAVRITAVKAAGGRAGLCAKLKKMRRSPTHRNGGNH